MASEDIGRFWQESLARYFLPDSGLVYDSGTPAYNGRLSPEKGSSPRREALAACGSETRLRPRR